MAATPVVVNGDTSLVLINTRDLIASQAAVVLLSSIQTPGRVVTIRDSVGFLSSPQTIIVSTLPNVSFADGASSVTLTQPYSYLTVTSRDPFSWNITNTFAFPHNQTVANVLSLTASSITARNIFVESTVSTTAAICRSFTFTSTASIQGPVFISTLIVGSANYQPLTTDPGFSAYIQGNTRLLSNLDVGGTAFVAGQMSTGSNLFVAGNISTLGSVGARGDIQTIGSIYAPFGGVFTRNLEVRGGATIGGLATFSNSLSIQSTLAVQDGISTLVLGTSTLSVLSQISMQEKTIQYRPNDLLFSAPITVPSLSTNFITASNQIFTSNLTVTSTIFAETTNFITLSSTAITNPHGSLTISSLTTNVATVSTNLSTQLFQTSSVAASSILLAGSINAPGTGYINVHSATISSISTNFIGAGTIEARAISTPALSLQFLTIASTLIANNLSTCFMSNVNIVNTGGSITTNTLATRTLLITSTLSTTSGIITSPAITMRLVSSNVIMDTASISTLAASSMTVSSLTATRLTMGAPPAQTNGPTFSATSYYPSTNVVTTGGPGDYLTPYFVSNVKPPGINTGDPYTVELAFSLNFNGPVLPGYYASILGLTLYPNGELNSQISIRTYNDSNTLVTLYGLFGTDQTYATPSNSGGIPVPPAPLPSSFIHVVGTMYGNSAFSLQFLSRFNDNFTSIDSNNVITMQNGVLRWPFFLNGTTIQNSLNDMSVRNIYYYGALNFASDPRLKEQVQLADLDRCRDIIEQIPLKRYKYIDAYLSTFQTTDVHRLGVLATDMERVFPKSVTYTCLEGVADPVRLIDTQQLDMAHIGATQDLMQRVSTLSTLLSAIQSEVSTLKNLANS